MGGGAFWDWRRAARGAVRQHEAGRARLSRAAG